MVMSCVECWSFLSQIIFIQELHGFLIDKSEITSLIVGGDWNCTLAKKDKSGGSKWKPTNFRNGILMMIEMFDLIEVQRKCPISKNFLISQKPWE